MSNLKNDTKILEELIGMSIPVEEFETEIGKVMKKRSTAHLYYSNKPDCIRSLDGTYHNVNYKCVPEDKKCQNFFCLVLEHSDGKVFIKEGFLEKI